MSLTMKSNASNGLIYCTRFKILLTCAGVVGISTQADAFTINATFDSGMPVAAQTAFTTAAAVYTGIFSNPVTINIKVGWGNVGGQAMPSGTAGYAQAAITGFWTYPQVRSYLAPNVTLPATQSGPAIFAMTRAEGKALGLVAATSTISDGSIGFNSTLTYSYKQSSGIVGYDFIGLAEHEIAHILGRYTANQSAMFSSKSAYQLPVDLFRYSAPGVQNYSYTDAAYFSLDGGVTNLGWFNNTGTGADRVDWLTGSGGSYPNDIQDAYLYPGATSISPADLAMLGALGWTRTTGTTQASGTAPGQPVGGTGGGAGLIEVPEPPALTVMAAGTAGLVLVLRRQVPTGRRRAAQLT